MDFNVKDFQQKSIEGENNAVKEFLIRLHEQMLEAAARGEWKFYRYSWWWYKSEEDRKKGHGILFDVYDKPKLIKKRVVEILRKAGFKAKCGSSIYVSWKNADSPDWSFNLFGHTISVKTK